MADIQQHTGLKFCNITQVSIANTGRCLYRAWDAPALQARRATNYTTMHNVQVMDFHESLDFLRHGAYEK